MAIAAPAGGDHLQPIASADPFGGLGRLVLELDVPRRAGGRGHARVSVVFAHVDRGARLAAAAVARVALALRVSDLGRAVGVLVARVVLAKVTARGKLS